MTASASFSSSETQIIAALFRSLARCRSTQLYDTFSLPPTNHFQNGGWLVSSVVCQYWSQSRSSAYSRKHSGKYFSLKRSTVAGSLRLACPINFAGGWKYSSSFQWTAICASFSPVLGAPGAGFGFPFALLAALRALATALASPWKRA